MSLSTWYHLMVTRDSGSARVYLNGVESSSGSQNVGTIAMPFNKIGATSSDASLMDGKLDEMACWDGVGTLQNAIDLFNAGLGADAESIIPNAIWHYHFDQSGNDTIAVDSSINGNDGTLTNFDFTTSPWTDHFTGVPSALNANVASQTYTYHGSDTDAFLDLFIATADQVTTGRTIDSSGNTISPYALAIITDLIDNYQVNVIT